MQSERLYNILTFYVEHVKGCTSFKKNMELKKNFEIDFSKIYLTSLIFTTLFCAINTVNLHGDIQYYNMVYKDIKNLPFKYLYPNFFNTEIIYPFQQSEFLLKFLFWFFSSFNIPKIFFDFIFINIFIFCFFYISMYMGVKSIFTFFFFLCSFYSWNIIFSSIKNVIAFDFFFISLIFYLKEKKIGFFLFYSASIFIASGFIIFYLFFFIFDLKKLIYFLKQNKFIKLFFFRYFYFLFIFLSHDVPFFLKNLF